MELAVLNIPNKVENITEPINPNLAPAAASTKILDGITGIDLPTLTQERASTPPNSIVGLDTSEDVTDIELANDEAVESIRPDAPVELNDLDDVTAIDPLEQPKELEEAPMVEAPTIPEILAPEAVDPVTPPVEQPIELTAPTDPNTLEAPVVANLAEMPIALVDPKKKAEDKGTTGVTSSKINTTSDPSSNKLPKTRSERRLPNTGTETSLFGQGMGAFMTGAAGSLLFWKRRKAKHNK
ncbi:LPXTG cell wall anchor domain-containing protein [Enterococcus crotali]|uniref:LPXTG cell wall anchor domain-containing protein n=1 Tax=Enterococcus crotali TaxID=1453587 RepID=UPI000B1519B9|nr:LPXTG cell wall anchor domain-containing protein [Enterococcus crotali]